MEKMELWKKKGSDHFRDILNPYGEKSNYGKIGRRRRLSKLNGFFSIILSVTIYIYNIIYIYIYNIIYIYTAEQNGWFDSFYGTCDSNQSISW